MNEAALLIAMAPREGANGTFVFMLNVVMIIGIFYFLLIRPQQKEQQRHRDMIESIKRGDEIVTVGGIVGSVIKVDEKQIIVKTAGDTKVAVERSKIAKKIEATGE